MTLTLDERSCVPILPSISAVISNAVANAVVAYDETLLHMQQSFAGQLFGFERAQLPVGGPEHFHPPSPGLLPQIIRRQYPARQ